MTRWEARTADAAATAALGRALGRTAPDGAVLLLEGPLGAGKTTLAQGVGAGCGVDGPIASPTYTLVAHHAGERPFVHADLYRLSGPADLATLDLDEILEPEGVACVEWPGLVRGLARPPLADLAIAPEGGARRIAGTFSGAGWDAARAALAALGATPDPGAG